LEVIITEIKLFEITEVKQKTLGGFKTKYRELFGQERSHLLLIRK
jgi:hypothetical protein